MKFRAVLFLVVAAVLWSLGGILIKLVAWNPLAIAGMRSAIAALVMLAFRRKMHFNLGPAQLGGAACYAATVILFVIANKWTTAANAILLQYTASGLCRVAQHMVFKRAHFQIRPDSRFCRTRWHDPILPG